MTAPRPWRRLDDGLSLAVRLRPKAARDGIDGPATEADGAPVLAVRVTAPPEDGKANSALAALLAKRLRVAKSAVTITAGATARRKTVHVAGDPTRLESAMAMLLTASLMAGSRSTRG
ncbi:MAG: DUF167 family protein [Azospirillaceae bacterium]